MFTLPGRIDGKPRLQALVPHSFFVAYPDVSMLTSSHLISGARIKVLQERMEPSKIGIRLRASKTGDQSPLVFFFITKP
jgi:hypothetical protein